MSCLCFFLIMSFLLVHIFSLSPATPVPSTSTLRTDVECRSQSSWPPWHDSCALVVSLPSVFRSACLFAVCLAMWTCSFDPCSRNHPHPHPPATFTQQKPSTSIPAFPPSPPSIQVLWVGLLRAETTQHSAVPWSWLRAQRVDT